MLSDLKNRLVRLKAAPAEIALRAAPLIEARLRADAKTRRGNVPSFGKKGDAPISVDPRPEAILVHGPDWVLKKAEEKGQIDQWLAIVADAAARVMGG